MKKQFWLMKSEPGNYSIDDLARDKATDWTGVRNYQARNFMKQDMKPGDWALFYHSNAEPSGVVGLMRIKNAAHADRTAFEKKGAYYEPRATPENPVWECVDVEFVEKFPETVPLSALRSNKKLAQMMVLKKGSRLSIQPVSEKDFLEVCRMAQAKTRLSRYSSSSEES